MADLDTKAINERIQTAWDAMKKTIEEQQAAIKKADDDRASIGELKAKQERIETDMQKMEDELKALKVSSQRPVLDYSAAGDPEHKNRYRNADHERLSSLFWQSMRVGIARMPEDERKEVESHFNTQRIAGMDPAERKSLKVYLDAEKKALSVGDETAGGYLAPPELVQDIIKGVQLISPIRPLAQVRQTSRRAIQYPVRSGVFAAKWVAETGTRSETAGLTYALEEIPNHEMYADVLISDQDLEDAVFNIEQEILDNATEQFAKAEGSAFVNGSGQGQPEGLLTNASLSTDNPGASATGNVTAAGLITMWGNLKTVYSKQATWLMNRALIAQCRGLVDGQGRFLWEPGLADGTPPNLLGSPYMEVPDMPNTPTATGTTFPILYGNIKRGYLIVDRINIVVRRLQEKYAESGQIAYLIRKRVGGQVVLPEAIRKYGAQHT